MRKSNAHEIRPTASNFCGIYGDWKIFKILVRFYANSALGRESASLRPGPWFSILGRFLAKFHASGR